MTKAFKNECIISFLISVTIISLAFVFAGVYPFGPYTAACSDMRMQFLDLTAALFDRLKNGENIFVTYSGGLGINLYAFAVYLLFCPLNILFLFFDKAYYQEVYLVITVIKFGIAAAGASFYLKHSRFTALSGSLNIAFALVYAFCEYNIHTVINIMWLDNTALLPLVLLGIEQAVDRRKIKLLFFSYLL
ncbi:MAG: YfhO family protein, partial [Firmicutes bacterium]|nr:YfhO family protein [Bacillota bacterium]